MASSARDLVRNLKSKPEEKKQVYSEWTRCNASGCILMSSHKANNIGFCTYHAGKESNYWPAITEAIKEEKMLIRKLHQMTTASSHYWNDKRPQMMGWDFFPMEEGEPPSIYLMRFSVKVQQVIYETASKAMGQ